MDPKVLAVTAVAIASCVCVVITLALLKDKRVFGVKERENSNTCNSQSFEDACKARKANWFKKKIRCTKRSLVLIYQVVLPAWPTKPRHNSKHSVFKRLALAMTYFAQGGQIDQTASLFGISKTRGLEYVNEAIEAL